MRSIRPVCLSCQSFEVEAVIEEQAVEVELFCCFDCCDVFYFMADARPRVRQLNLSELYEQKAPI
jgi:hypothetical protein